MKRAIALYVGSRVIRIGDAGRFEESKHPRADDGKFGAGPGKSHIQHAIHHLNESQRHGVGGDGDLAAAHVRAAHAHMDVDKGNHAALVSSEDRKKVDAAHTASKAAHDASQKAAHAANAPPPKSAAVVAYEAHMKKHDPRGGLTAEQHIASASNDPQERARLHAAGHETDVANATGSKEAHDRAHLAHASAAEKATTPEIKGAHEEQGQYHKGRAERRRPYT